jgi:hypothetical protein
MTVLTGISTVNHFQICYLFSFLTCTEINHIHVLLLVGILMIKHAMNYTEGKVYCAFSTPDMLMGMNKKTKRELNITFKLLNQGEE